VELRQYLAVLRRRWPVIGLIVLLSALFSAWTLWQASPTYSASVRLLVRQQPSPENQPFFTYDRYYNWFANEFLSDDYTLIVPSRAFAERVAALLRQNPPVNGQPKYGNIDFSGVTADSVYGSLSADRKHRILTITARTGNYGNASAFANAAADALTAKSLGNQSVPSLSDVKFDDRAEFALLDSTNAVGTSSSRSRAVIDAGVRFGLGLVAALALAFLIEFFDNRLRDDSETERLLGVPVIGAIPRK
jgi:capsular polysaccharide biosynthesis protein